MEEIKMIFTTISWIITGLLLLLLLFRIPGPLHSLGRYIKEKTHSKIISDLFAWLTHGWKFTRWKSIKTPLFLCISSIIISIVITLIFSIESFNLILSFINRLWPNG